MAMRAARLSTVLVVVLALGACKVLGFIFGSIFPATTTLITAQASLSSQIPSGIGGSFGVKVVETGGFGYVVVVGSLPATGTTAFFYDLDLNLKATFTNLASSGVMVDSSGVLVVGSLHLNPADLSPAGTGTIPFSLGSPGNSGVDGFVSGGSNLAGFGINGATLNWQSYPSGWTSPTNFSATLSSMQSGLQVTAVLDDGGVNVILVVSPGGGGGNNNNTVTGYFLTVAKSSFSPTTNLLDVSPHRDNLYRGSFGFVQGSIFAYDTGSSSFVRIDPSTGATQSEFSSGNESSETTYAYRVGGKSFYGFDSKTRQLTRYSAWW